MFLKKIIRQFSVWLEKKTFHWVVPKEVYIEIRNNNIEPAVNILRNRKFGDTESAYIKLSTLVMQLKIFGKLKTST